MARSGLDDRASRHAFRLRASEEGRSLSARSGAKEHLGIVGAIDVVAFSGIDLRGIGHHTPPHGVDHRTGCVPQRSWAGGVSDLAGEVDNLTNPADKVAGRQVSPLD